MPPNLDVPADKPCLTSGSLPSLILENNKNRTKASKPLTPVNRTETSRTNITLVS